MFPVHCQVTGDQWVLRSGGVKKEEEEEAVQVRLMKVHQVVQPAADHLLTNRMCSGHHVMCCCAVIGCSDEEEE